MSSNKKGLACVKPADRSIDSHSYKGFVTKVTLSKDPSFA